jgi:hypothetical protein
MLSQILFHIRAGDGSDPSKQVGSVKQKQIQFPGFRAAGVIAAVITSLSSLLKAPL